ncbi:ABC transporter related [Candidatus Korarchaeum cryptofilum OPF8]|uniref:ABC transporter related n=1 Tax=Korarchaeum cryptofilum (strain OPF8) TaxID=374847 RepID=B1L3N9_KORCO|nr:ABC transporter related [Candidatus Korarchaeum cryptofilum OPF8]
MEVLSLKLVEMRGITKVYPDGVVALRGVDFEASEGEIHGLLGENGAGKTTLMRILYGEIKQTSGEIIFSGRAVSFKGPWDSMRSGISMVYQRFSLVPTMSVLENFYLYLSSFQRVGIEEVKRRAEDVMERLKFRVPLEANVEDLPVGVQQRVEIIKVLLSRPKLIIFDEPTSVLTPIESRELFRILKELREEGIAIIFITHKLREAKEITDRVTILRKGERVGTYETPSVSEEELAIMMVGRGIVPAKRSASSPGGEVMRVEDLWVRDDRGLHAVKGVSFELHEGEIFGIAGVQGNGQLELAEALAGMRRAERGRILLDGRDITDLPAEARYREGLAYIPDSRAVGLVLEMNLMENSILTSLRSFLGRGGRIIWPLASGRAGEIIERFNIVGSVRSQVKYLSGGNQQRLLVGREIIKAPKVLIVSEPTQGLDVAATEFIRSTLLKFREEGRSIILISSDLDEIFELCDRIAVIYEGKFVGIERSENLTLERLGLLMGGVNA